MWISWSCHEIDLSLIMVHRSAIETMLESGDRLTRTVDLAFEFDEEISGGRLLHLPAMHLINMHTGCTNAGRGTRKDVWLHSHAMLVGEGDVVFIASGHLSGMMVMVFHNALRKETRP